MVPDTPDVEQVLFGANGAIEGLSAGKIVVDMSSISPIETKAFAERVRAAGADYVDAPVSGGAGGCEKRRAHDHGRRHPRPRSKGSGRSSS